MVTKQCTGCGANVPLKEFYRDRRASDGRQSECKECSAKRQAEYYAKPHEELLRRKRKYCAENRQANIDRCRRWRLAHLEEKRAYDRRYYHEHKQERQVYYHKWRKERFADYYQENSDRLRRYCRQWAKDHPEIIHIKDRRRRARLANAEGMFTDSQFDALCAKYDWRCTCCGTPHTERPLTVDHVVPLSQGGSNDIANIQPLCLSCNSSKRDKTADYRKVRRMD